MTKTNDKVNQLYNSASMAVGSNGYGILKMPKYAAKIAETRIHTLSNGLVTVKWVTEGGDLVMDAGPGMRDWYPVIGKIVKK